MTLFVGAGNDYAKDKQFRKLNDVKDTIEIKTLRGGHLAIVTNHDIVVGDVVILDAGDKIIADMIMFESHGLVIDEASLTGESDPIKKTIDSDPWIRSGTQVCRANTKMYVSVFLSLKLHLFSAQLLLGRFLKAAEKRWLSQLASTVSGERP